MPLVEQPETTVLTQKTITVHTLIYVPHATIMPLQLTCGLEGNACLISTEAERERDRDITMLL